MIRTIYYFPCGEKVCRKDCEVCDILLFDRMNKTYKVEQLNGNTSNLKGVNDKR